MTDLRRPATPPAFWTILGLVFAGLAFGSWLFWPDPGQLPANRAPELAAEAVETAAPHDIADARAAAARLAEGGFRLSRLAVQLLLVVGVLILVWQFARWVLARPPPGELAEPVLGTVAVVTMASAFAVLGPAIASLIGGMLAVVATLGASEGQSFATVAPGEGILPSGVMVAWVDRLVAWVGEAGANPASWAYLGCAFVSLVLLGIVLGVSVLIYADLFLVSLAGVVTLGLADLTEMRGAASQLVTSVLGLGVKLLTLLLVVDMAGRVTGEIGHAAGGGTLEDALSVVLLQILCVLLILVLPATLERRVLLGRGEMAPGAWS